MPPLRCATRPGCPICPQVLRRSPGESWGRHWLDVAGYFETDGNLGRDRSRPYAYKYRDYVLRSFNADKPFDRLHQSWPALAALKLKDVDLLACGRDEAERTVASSLKTAEAQLAGKKKIRRLRNLAESYRTVLPRLFELTFMQREQVFQGWQTPAPRPSRAGKEVGPLAYVPSPRKILSRRNWCSTPCAPSRQPSGSFWKRGSITR